MSTDQKQEGEVYRGKPEEVGTQLFLDALGPTLAETMKDHGPEKCARVLAGVLAGYAGLVLENFGPQAAMEMLRGTADNIERSLAPGQVKGH